MTGERPVGWHSVPLASVRGDCGVFIDGDWVESKDQDPNGQVRLIQLADVGDGRFLDKSARFMRDDQAERLGCTFLQTDDVLVSRMADPLGRACRFPGATRRCVTVVDVCIIRPDRQICEPQWLMYHLNAPPVRAEIQARASGTTRARVSRSNLGELLLELPPLNEQRRIVAKLEDLLARSRRAKDALDAIPPLLEKLRQSILAAAFRGDLTADWRAKNPDIEPAEELLKRIRIERRKKWEETELAKLRAKGKAPADDRWKAKYKEPEPVDASELPELPEGWCWASIETVGDVLLGRRRSAEEYVVGEGGREMHPYVRVANVKRDRLELTDVLQMPFSQTELALYTLLPGDIVLSEGQSPELVGQSGIFRGGYENLCIQATVHRFRAFTGLSSEYAQLVFLNHLVAGTFMRASSLTTNIAHLTSERLRPLPFPLAPSAEQIELVRRSRIALDGTGTLSLRVRVASQSCAQLDQSTLTKAFRGELVDQDPNDEPASVMLERLAPERQAAQETPAALKRSPRQKARA